MNNYEAVVIGAGHAGIEAAFALANKGHKVALISLSKDHMAMMPCNPSIGGPAKGIITREIDALGGMQGIFADKAMIQVKMLNESRGPAVRAIRAQIDKEKYSELIKEKVLANKNIDFIEDMVEELIIENKIFKGVKTSKESVYASKGIITTGTYMDSYILRGEERKSEGPSGQKTTNKLSQSLLDNEIELQRLKTGTPPRIYTDSIDFSELEKEYLKEPSFSFSNRSGIKLENQIYCYLGYTNEKTHEIINKNLDRSSMYSGLIKGVGPRYCPSIEDKVVRFSDKNRHQLFFEPETSRQDIIYLQGFSTSMPVEVQKEMLATLPGLKNARVQKWAYAIEYDAINPMQLQHSLELKDIKGLYFAGQVNGTSGYEEAAGQGLVAGINAGLSLEGEEPIIIQRDKGYIGVLIDDLVTKGTKEPYRMLTSRAEYRLLLRNDNADQRLTGLGHEVGLISDEYHKEVLEKYQTISNNIDKFKNTFLSSNDPLAKKYNIKNGPSLMQLIARPDFDISDFAQYDFIYETSVNIRLAGYIKKQETEAKKMRRLEKLKIPKDLDYSKVLNLATEARQKFMHVKPETIGQATRISGINPADIQMLMFYLEYKREKNAN